MDVDADTAMESRKTPLRILSGFTFVFFFGSALCWAIAQYKTSIVRRALTNAVKEGNWGDYEAALRNEWSGLDWFICFFILLCLAIGTGIFTLVYWKTGRAKKRDEEGIL